jgi:hypothetical protein
MLGKMMAVGAEREQEEEEEEHQFRGGESKPGA